MRPTVGIIANPSSGKDIRRLVAHATVFNNNEKINIIKRVLLGLDALGIKTVLAMPDTFGMILDATKVSSLSLTVELLDMPIKNTADDSSNAAKLMADAGVGCIVTLGGDGTNKAVAKGCGYVPLVPISTGTNNAFPVLVEGTLAGMAAAVVALRVPSVREAGIRLAPRLDVYRNDVLISFALVDIVVYAERFVASGAIWDPKKIKTVVLSRPRPGTIGASAIGGYLPQVPATEKAGMWLELGDEGQSVMAPIAPGVVSRLTLESWNLLKAGDKGEVTTAPAVLAMDGEREIPIKEGEKVEIQLSHNGPHVVDVSAALHAAAQEGFFVQDQF
ncbi:MAG: NAD(+)/NADH kinase [Chloroflexota bacterium]